MYARNRFIFILCMITLGVMPACSQLGERVDGAERFKIGDGLGFGRVPEGRAAILITGVLKDPKRRAVARFAARTIADKTGIDLVAKSVPTIAAGLKEAKDRLAAAIAAGREPLQFDQDVVEAYGGVLDDAAALRYTITELLSDST